MASQYVIDLGYNDDLTTVIKKVNHNFKAVMGQQSKQAQIESEDAANVVAQIVGDAVDDLVDLINHEADLRAAGDNDLDNAIEAVDDKFDDYTPTTNLARTVLPYSHDDVLWIIENNTVSEVMKKTNVSGYTDLVVRCVGEDGNPCYTPLVLIPEDSYQNYIANGKTFKMQINTSDNGRLWWVVPAGKWELWMR